VTTQILEPEGIVASRYKVLGYVGAGGMQQVYQAYDNSLKRIVALKVPKNDSAKKRFQRSAAMSAKVTHPNVAKTFDYLIEDGRQYLVEEFIEGEDLKSRLTSHFFVLDPHLAAHVFHHLVRGLDAVHSVGVIHRDMKPSNIMVSCDPDISVIKITDFGISKMMEEELEENMKGENSMFGSETIVGALPYMAPEVISNKDDVSLKADIWSAGAILYELLTGDRPFGDGPPAIANILKGVPPAKPPMLTTTNQFGPLIDDLWKLLMKCFTADPVNRPSAKDLVKECGRLCYSTAPRCIGYVRDFRTYSGNWGFINREDMGASVFFHGDSFYGQVPANGVRVSLAMFPGTPSPRAHPVLAIRPRETDDTDF
jgi:eukaryotic-like serine/threonine-protein kinase